MDCGNLKVAGKQGLEKADYAVKNSDKRDQSLFYQLDGFHVTTMFVMSGKLQTRHPQQYRGIWQAQPIPRKLYRGSDT